MKIRFTGNQEEFDKLLPILIKKKMFFDSFRKPQLGSNPKYKVGGEKYNPKIGEQQLMYLDIDVNTLLKDILKSR